MPDPKKYKTPNGTVVEETVLREKYGERFDGLVENGTITSEIDEPVYLTPNGSSVTESTLKQKYGNRFDKLVSDNVLKLDESFKKKSDSQPTSTVQESDSEAQKTDGSSDIIDNRGQLVKDIDSGKLDQRMQQLSKENQILQEKENSSYGSELWRSLKKGSARLGRNLAATPEFIYDVFAIPQNTIADMVGNDNLKASSEKFKEKYEIDNVIKDFYAGRTEELQKESQEVEKLYIGGITDNFNTGNYVDGFRLLGKSITESLPSSIGIALTGGASSAPVVLGATTTVFGADKNEELKSEDPQMSVQERAIKSLGSGFAEGIFSTIGTGGIGVAAKEIIKKEGKEQGAIILKENLVKMYTELLKKYPIPTAMAGEGIEEAATQITQNAIDGKPLMEGVSDAFLVGMGSGGAFGTALAGLKQANKENNNTSAIDYVELTKDKESLLKEELELQVKEGDISSKEAKDIYDNWEEIKDGLKAVPENFTSEQKVKAIDLIKEKKTIEKEIEGKDPNLVEDKKARIEEINSELKNINAKKQETAQQEEKSEVLPKTDEVVQENQGIEDTPSPTVELNPDNTNKNENQKIQNVQQEQNQVENLQEETQVNETQAQGDTVTDGNLQPRVEPSLQQGQVDNAQSTNDTKPSQETVKRVNPKGVKGEFDVSFDQSGKVSKITSSDGREIPKFIESKSKKGKTYIKKNANYSRIEAEATGGITENQSKEESKQRLNEAIDRHIPNDAYSYALDYMAKGGSINLESAKKETGYGDKDLKWVTRNNNKFEKSENLPTVEATAEYIVENSEQELDVQEVRNALIEIMGTFESTNDVQQALIERVEEMEAQELMQFKGSLNEKELSLLESIMVEDEYISQLSDKDAIEYFEDKINSYEQGQQATIKQQELEANGKSGEIGTNSPQKQKGKTGTEQIDSDVQSQGISLSKQKNRDSALSEEGSVKQKNTRQRKFKRFWQNTFSSSRGLSKKIVREVESLFGELSSISAALKYEASQFADISKQVKKQFKSDYNQKMKDINDYLSGITTDISFLNKEQQDQLQAFRGRIDNLSDKIIKTLEDKKKRLTNDAAIERIDKLIETIEGNKGKYIFRQYDAFSNPDYLPSLTGKYPNASAKKRLQNAIDYLVAEDGLTPEESKTQILEYLDSIKNSGDFVSSSVSGKAKAPFLKKRQDIPEPIRELLGESKDPVKNYISTVYKMSNYIANLEYQSRLSDALNELGLSSDKMKEGYTKLTTSGEGWDFLQDIYVSEEIKEGIDDLQPLESLKDAPYRKLVQASAATKLFKTVLSPTTMARNFLSGFFLSFNAGFNPLANPKKFINGIQQAWGGKKSQTKLKDENQKLIKLGIIQDGAVSREVLGIMNDFGKNTDKILSKNAIDKFMDVMQRLYALGDDSFKVVGFYQWQNRYLKEGFSKSEAEQLAAERIRNGFPTYSKIPRNIQKLRRIPLIGTFPSFTYEVWRTNANNIKYIGQDLKAGRYKMASQQATGMLMATSTAYAISELSKSLLGIDDDEDDTTRNMAAPWQKDSKNIYLGKKNGIYEVVDGTAFFPQETILKPLRILFEDREGRDIDDKISLATKEATGTFLGADILTKTIAEVSLNQNNYGDKIYRGENILEGIANDPDKITNYILRQAGPGLYNNLVEFARANEVAPEYFGEKETSYKEYTNQEALLGLLGLRVSRINYVSGLSSMAAESKDALRTERTNTTKKLKNSKKLSYDDILEEVKNYQKYNKENHEQIIVGVRGAKKQGIPVYEIEQSLKRRGYSKEDIQSIYFGHTPKLKPISSTTVKNKEIDLKIGRLKDDPEKLFKSIMKLNTNVDTFNYLVEMANYGISLDKPTQ